MTITFAANCFGSVSSSVASHVNVTTTGWSQVWSFSTAPLEAVYAANCAARVSSSTAAATIISQGGWSDIWSFETAQREYFFSANCAASVTSSSPLVFFEMAFVASAASRVDSSTAFAHLIANLAADAAAQFNSSMADMVVLGGEKAFGANASSRVISSAVLMGRLFSPYSSCLGKFSSTAARLDVGHEWAAQASASVSSSDVSAIVIRTISAAGQGTVWSTNPRLTGMVPPVPWAFILRHSGPTGASYGRIAPPRSGRYG